jgi:hypothetical protein
MRDMKKQMYAEELLLHRVATTPVHRCCDYRVLLGARLPEVSRERCMRNDAGGGCVAPPRLGRRRVTV